MKKSTLLNFLCDYAKSISESFGKSAITADHFMIAVLKTMCDDRDGKLPADIRTPEVSFEFLKINTLLHHYPFQPV